MSQLHSQFDYKCNQFSPVIGDVCRSKSIDKDGIEHVSFKPVDYEKIRKANGSVDNWTLNAMLKAGINPNQPIHTSINTRMEGISQVNAATEYADKLLNPDTENNEQNV